MSQCHTQWVKWQRQTQSRWDGGLEANINRAFVNTVGGGLYIILDGCFSLRKSGKAGGKQMARSTSGEGAQADESRGVRGQGL